MRKIATVNGVPIYTDKGGIASIVNTRITFHDGSWCDVSTGQIVNKGNGSISFGGSNPQGSSVEDTVSDTVDYNASDLDLRDLDASVDVQPWDGTTIRVTVSGPASEVQNIVREVRGSSLVIKSKGGSGGNASMIIGRGSKVSIVGGGRGSSIHIGSVGGSISIGGSHESPVQIKVEVPGATPIRFAGLEGPLTIGDTGSALKGKMSGVGSVNAGRVGNTDVKISGVGDFTAQAVNGDLTVKLSGVGSVRVRDGQIGEMSVDVTGVGSAAIGGTAQNADLDASGVGNITVDHVVNRPREHSSGIGRIRVRRIG